MGTIAVLDLMGGVALLLWGLHMVRSGILRAWAAIATLAFEGPEQPHGRLLGGLRAHSCASEQHGDRHHDGLIRR
jgi:hypothetical protein